MTQLDPRERLIFDYIKESVRTMGYPPSVRDICSALQIKSTSTVHGCLKNLEQKGYIQRDNGKSRTLHVCTSENDTSGDGETGVKIPLLGHGAEGSAILSEENYEGYLTYPSGLCKINDREMLAIRMSGVGMSEAGILDGDIVIIEKTPIADDGDIVAVLIGEDITVRRFYKEDGHFRLQPENRSMLPIIVNSLTIIGRVVTCIRYYNT